MDSRNYDTQNRRAELYALRKAQARTWGYVKLVTFVSIIAVIVLGLVVKKVAREILTIESTIEPTIVAESIVGDGIVWSFDYEAEETVYLPPIDEEQWERVVRASSFVELPEEQATAVGPSVEEKLVVASADIVVLANETTVPASVVVRYAKISWAQGERDLLAKLIQLEAGGESLEGKSAVAEVVFNRVLADGFPDTITGVIYDKYDGRYEFEAVPDLSGAKPTQACYDAIDLALSAPVLPGALQDGRTVVFFRAGGWENKHHAVTIGGHNFCYAYKW